MILTQREGYFQKSNQVPKFFKILQTQTNVVRYVWQRSVNVLIKNWHRCTKVLFPSCQIMLSSRSLEICRSDIENIRILAAEPICRISCENNLYNLICLKCWSKQKNISNIFCKYLWRYCFYSPFWLENLLTVYSLSCFILCFH